MVTARRPRLLTLEEYLVIERGAPAKSEFVRGEVFAMVGGTIAHSLVTANVIRALGTRVDGRRCRVFDSNLRLWIRKVDVVTYPDVMVICGKPEFHDDKPADTVTNPSLIVEVLSPSTEAYDRGEKFAAYRTLPSLKHYLLVSQERPQVELFSRDGNDGWTPSSAVGLDATIALGHLEIALPLAELYAGTES